jgi:hypothetical protein
LVVDIEGLFQVSEGQMSAMMAPKMARAISANSSKSFTLSGDRLHALRFDCVVVRAVHSVRMPVAGLE